MTSLPRISDAEWQVMKLIWEESPITANDVVSRLREKSEWNHRTIRTMLNRLVKKGALSVDHRGKTYLYRPAVDQDACVGRETKSFVDRVFGGALSPSLINFVKNSELSDDDVEQLKQVLAEKEK